MKKLILILLVLCSFSLKAQEISSPNGECKLNFYLTENGEPMYEFSYKNKKIIEPSLLGLDITDYKLYSNFEILDSKHRIVDKTWKPVLGEYKEIRDHHNRLIVTLQHKTLKSKLIIRFRVYDEGLAFRYEINDQPVPRFVKYYRLLNDKTEFNLTKDYDAYWLPSDFDSQEYVTQQTKLSKVNSTKALKEKMEVETVSSGGENVVQSPLLLTSPDGLHIHIYEAALINYPAMHLAVDKTNFDLKIKLADNAEGIKAQIVTPSVSPWRTIIVSDDAKKIISGSKMILNLNDPSEIENTSWIKPIKYIGVWWEMHVGLGDWHYQEPTDNTKNTKIKPHSANTENVKRHIDFAKKHGFDAVLVEGWNTGWDKWMDSTKKENAFDYVTPYADFNINEVNQYAIDNNIKIILHSETAGSINNYDKFWGEITRLMTECDYSIVKTGYVGKLPIKGEVHDGQYFINHVYYTIQRMAQNNIMINTHESPHPTGLHRTYPNFLSSEAARGNEYNAWSEGNPPNHETILPFTRMLGGPMDYTPGIFETKMSAYGKSSNSIKTTLAKQLALYVIIYSPLQMAADLIDNYEKHLDAFQFIKDVALDWDDTKVLEAKVGEYVTIARKTKGKNEWFLGAITNEDARKTTIDLSFLPHKKTYIATIYEDGVKADWKNNPKSYNIRTIEVNHKSSISLNLAKGGGTAISFKEKSTKK